MTFIKVEDRRLFIGKVQKTLSEEELREAFAPFGEIENLYIVREMNDPKLCKGNMIEFIWNTLLHQTLSNFTLPWLKFVLNFYWFSDTDGY